MRVTVTGLGYLGLVHAAALCELGNTVLGMDADERKVALLKAGGIPFHEPELDELVFKHTASGALQFTADVSEAAKFANAHFLCVGTPTTPSGLPDLHYLFDAVESLCAHFKGPENFIIGKSTTPPGTAAQLLQAARHIVQDRYVDVAWNPEFLREGSAVGDSLYPSRIVFGVNNTRAEMVLRDIYQQQIRTHTGPYVTDVATSEMAKLASNAFLAMKISFINGIAQYCDTNGGDIQQLARIMGADGRIGMMGMQPGLGWGGGCLPKDVAMLTHLADRGESRRLAGLLKYTTRINDWRREQVFTQAKNLLGTFDGKTVAVLGLAFKPGTSDIRESPGMHIAAMLQDAGATVVTHDPHALTLEFYREPTPEQAIQDADLVIVATAHPEYGKLEPSSFPPGKIIDGRFVLDRKKWEAAGWEYHEVGR